MQNIASPLQFDIVYDAASQHLAHKAESSAVEPEQGSDLRLRQLATTRRIEGPDLSGAIERVLAWHRSRRNH